MRLGYFSDEALDYMKLGQLREFPVFDIIWS